MTARVILLALRYPPGDIHNAYRGVTSQKPKLQANAIEFLDNLLDQPFKRYILPIIELKSIDELVRDLPSDVADLREENYLALLLEGLDNWLKALALFLIGELQEPALFTMAAEHTDSAIPIIRETAEYVVNKLKASY